MPSIIHDILYASAKEQVLDVYADPAGSRPAVVLVHGGGWFRGDKSKEQKLATILVDAGFLVFVPNYRLAPDHPFPAGREDVLAAADWARASGDALDRERRPVPRAA